MRTTGSCLCGDIQWACDMDSESYMSHCHCSMCRKEHGSAYATFVSVVESEFRWLAGEAVLARYRATPESSYQRTFCPRCGSAGPMFLEDRVAVPAGCMDGDPGARPQCHTFAGSQHNAPWFPITDDLKQFESQNSGSTLPVVEPPAPPKSSTDHIAGSCLCGRVVFHITASFAKVHHCHCRRCQKGRAAAHATNGIVALSALTFVEGEDNLVSYKVPEAEVFEQVFCRTCGSLMPESYPQIGQACVSLGALDSDPKRSGDDNIFVAYAAPWTEIPDAPESYEEAPPSYD